MFSYPLEWPAGWDRTPPDERKNSQFKTGFEQARIQLLDEIRLLAGEGGSPVITCNIPMRKKDGLPYSKYSAPDFEPDDPGVAVYFWFNEEQVCIPCDKWMRVRDNLHAIELTINALRGIERWGAKEMVSAAFKGFEALPSPEDEVTTRDFNYFEDCKTMEELKDRFRELSKFHHPDSGGATEDFAEIHRQYKKREDELRSE